MDDLTAILRIKKRDMSGLEYLISRYQRKAVRIAFLVTRDEPLAEDVVQDAFLNFYQRIHQFDEHKPFEPYFMVSVTHAALNAVQRGKRIQPLDEEGGEDHFETLLSQSLAVESQVERIQLKQELLILLERLSPRQRAVVVQRYYLEMSEKEMSEISQTAPGTIKWLLNSARARLRLMLDPERTEE